MIEVDCSSFPDHGVMANHPLQEGDQALGPGSSNGGFARVALRGAKRVELPVQHWRINLIDLKSKLSKILGPSKEKEYCNIFSSFLSHRLSKAELDKRLLQTLGSKDSIVLHNQIVRAVLSNARCGQPPPRGRPSSGLLASDDPRKNKSDYHALPAAKRFKQSSGMAVLKAMEDEKEELDEDGEDNDEEEEEVQAPLGVPLCRQSVGGASQRSSSPVSMVSSAEMMIMEASELPDASSMQTRMTRFAAGLEVEHECANLVNHALDIHLKRLIKACIQTGRRRSSNHRISALDFRVAMENSRQLLGGNWPIHLETLSLLDHHY
ncbi:uncharacterized protein LOC9658309 [Selaginella moellendorffii]|nr:uncharacterized protein LOC9658309 [Selaginella moellendorffii]|eukprot:XP_002981113.2 uncharacterized protein LOC9658309 [Selaginella moellendorffii]